MADALNPVGNIHEGFWMDWTRNKLLGCTLTLCPTFTTILTNSLAMWVTLCGVQLWTIIRYTLYQRGESLQVEVRTPNLSGQQVILRNAGSALTTSHLMFGWAWNTRSSTGKRAIRAYAIAISAAVYYIVFTVAGVVSNHAITTQRINNGSAVLLRNPLCGVWNQTIYGIVEQGQYTDAHEFDLFLQNAAKKAYELQLSFEYAQECYNSSNTTETSFTCQTLKQPAINLIPTISTKCPFAPQICLEDSDTMVFDTGNLSSLDHFGINAVPHDRLKYQRRMECAVLNSTSYVNGWDGTIASPSDTKPPPETAYANYGSNLMHRTNWTYSYSNFASFYTDFSADTVTHYQVDAKQVLAPTDQQWLLSDFEPIQELVQETADVVLVFLSFTGMYTGKVDDPWFLATNQHHFNSPLPFTQERYSRDTAIGTLGCREQHQFCTNDDVCTGMLGFNQVQNVNSFNAILTPYQNATFDRILRAVEYSRIWYVIRSLSVTVTPLLAAKGAFDGNSGTTLSKVLPYDQWKLELEHYHSIAMAQLQRTVVRWATGQVAADPEYLLKPTDPQDIWFCNSLLVPSAVYTSFSVFAITFILLLGCIIISAGFFVERMASALRRCLKRSAPSRPWNRDDMIELQRRKTNAPRRFSQRMSRNATSPSLHSLPTPGSRVRSFIPNSDNVASRSIPQWQHARLPAPNSRIASPASCKTSPQSDGLPMREFWMPISLCSVDSNSHQGPSRTEAFSKKRRKQEPPSSRIPAAVVPHSNARVARSPTYTQYPEWI